MLLFFFTIICVNTKTFWHQLGSYKFETYQAEFGRNYNAEEVQFRTEIFEKNLNIIRRHNSNPTKSWKLGVNQFTDRTPEELNSYLGAVQAPKSLKSFLPTKFNEAQSSIFANVSVDWRTKGIITAVKDQGKCGSCWSFAAAETLESYWALHTGQLVTLSEQQILDCTANPKQCGGTGGCGGATVELGYAQVIKMGGLSSEWTYPYISYYGADFKCNNAYVKPVAHMSKYVNLPTNSLGAVLSHLTTNGPLAISVDASQWFLYEDGVFDGCNQTNPDLDHAVQLVGMGTDPSFGDYWLVRNSWTPAWGELGYIRLRRTSVLRCGIDLTPKNGDGCADGPPTEYVCGTCGILYDAVYPVIH